MNEKFEISDCSYFRKFDSKCSLIHCPYGGHPSCENVSNCQFKRLMEEFNEKLEECNQLKAKNLTYEESFKQIDNIVSGNYEILDPLAKKQIKHIIDVMKGSIHGRTNS